MVSRCYVTQDFVIRDNRSVGCVLVSDGRTGHLWYYRGLARAFTALGPANLAAELARTVNNLESCIEERGAGKGSQ